MDFNSSQDASCSSSVQNYSHRKFWGGLHIVDQNIPEITLVIEESNCQQNGSSQVRNAQDNLHVLANGTSSLNVILGAEALQTL